MNFGTKECAFSLWRRPAAIDHLPPAKHCLFFSHPVTLGWGNTNFADAGQQGFGWFVVRVLGDELACEGLDQNAALSFCTSWVSG